jgi:opacity protein-like surface antigen
MKQITLFLFLLLYVTTAAAQTSNYGRFDFEIGIDVPVAAGKIAGYHNHVGMGFSMEGRYQLQQVPVDIGLHIGVSNMDRMLDNSDERDRDEFRTAPILAVGDYQFGRGTRWNPYAGIGLGVSLNPNFGHADFAFMPRVGIRCFKFMSIDVSYLITRQHYSRLITGIGFYF